MRVRVDASLLFIVRESAFRACISRFVGVFYPLLRGHAASLSYVAIADAFGAGITFDLAHTRITFDLAHTRITFDLEHTRITF